MGWADELEQGSFAGVTFGVLSTSDSIERRVVDAEIPYRDGGEQDDLGRRPRPTTVQAVLFGSDYLAQLGALQLAVDSHRASTFVHPLLGTWQARCVRLSVEHESARRNECQIVLELREDGLDVATPDLFSVAAAATGIDRQLVAIAGALEREGLSASAVDTAMADGGRFASDLEAHTSELTARFDTLRQRAEDAITALEDTADDATSFEAIVELRRMVLQAKRLKERTERILPRVATRTVAAQTSMVSLSHALYGDASRAEALEELNRVTNPFALPAGTRLRIYVE